MAMKTKTRKLAVTGMMTAIMIVMGTTPLGFIPIGPFKITIMHLPVIIGAILEGPVVGLVLGLFFGLFSLYQAVTAPTILSPLFMDPLVSVLPRMIIWIADQSITIQIFSMHIDCTDLMVFIGCIIIDPLCDITAGSIKCNLVFSIGYFAASSLLIHGTENVKELAYAFFFGIA